MPDVVSAARRAYESHRTKVRRKLHRLDETEAGDGERMSGLLTWDVRLIPLADVRLDPNFKDARIYEDPKNEWSFANEGQYIDNLCETMRNEGLKVPICVQSADEKGKEIFLLRAGGRRRKAAEKLGWKEIPAIVLPQIDADTPLATRLKYEEWQRWCNVLENTSRKNLTTYELAVTAKRMRDEHAITAAEFARKTGYSPSYVSNLLGCLDRLPDYLIEQWRDGARVAFDQWVSLSYLEQDDAVRTYQRMVGMSPKDRLRLALKKRRRALPSPRALSRMQKLYTGIEGSELDPRTRDVVLRAIEICMGARDDIPGIYEPGRQRKYEAKARLRAELALPDLPGPGEEREMPPPMDEATE